MNSKRLIWFKSFLLADWRTQPKRVTAEYGSDLSLSCTFQDEDSDKTVKEFFDWKSSIQSSSSSS
jgi:hypothetical protein